MILMRDHFENYSFKTVEGKNTHTLLSTYKKYVLHAYLIVKIHGTTSHFYVIRKIKLVIHSLRFKFYFLFIRLFAFTTK